MRKRKELTGVVVSGKMLKTVVVRIMHVSKHKKYGKVVKKYNKYKAHDEKGIAKEGDTVCIVRCRPLSKDKRFRVVKVVKKMQVVHAAIEERTGDDSTA